MRKQVLIFRDIALQKPRTWKAKPVQKKIFVNTSVTEIFIFSYLSYVMAIPNKTGNVRVT